MPVADRIHFVHLRNVKKDERGNFHESDHLDGDVDMFEVMKRLVKINKKPGPSPFHFVLIMGIKCWTICIRKPFPVILRLAG